MPGRVSVTDRSPPTRRLTPGARNPTPILAPVLETERLILRPWRADDAGALYEMCRHEEVMRYIGDGRPWAGVERARLWLERQLAARAEHGVGKWAATERDGGLLVGSTGFDPPSGKLPEYEFGYLFARGAWGRGYATEAGRACLRYAFEELKLPRVVALVTPEHVRSRHVLEKLGFEFEGLRHFEGEPGPDAFYVARRADDRHAD